MSDRELRLELDYAGGKTRILTTFSSQDRDYGIGKHLLRSYVKSKRYSHDLQPGGLESC